MTTAKQRGFINMIDLALFLFALLVVVFFGLLIYALYREITGPVFTLQKDEWECTAQHTETQFVPQPDGRNGTMIVPTFVKVCDRYERIGARGEAQP